MGGRDSGTCTQGRRAVQRLASRGALRFAHVEQPAPEERMQIPVATQVV